MQSGERKKIPDQRERVDQIIKRINDWEQEREEPKETGKEESPRNKGENNKAS